jgi:EAL domain-containing protein (putative c-di-GMP-specific phosphodiesterase class I)
MTILSCGVFFDWRNEMKLKLSLLLCSLLGVVITLQALIRAIWVDSLVILFLAIVCIFVIAFFFTFYMLNPYQKLIAQLQHVDGSILEGVSNHFQEHDAINQRVTSVFKDVNNSLSGPYNHIGRRKIVENLRKDILEGSNQIYVVFQPKVSLSTGENVGMEALVRWENTKIGVVSPSTFIPIAEANGLIHSLWEKVMIEVCLQINKWKEQYGKEVSVAVNFSPVQFQDDNLVSKVKRIMDIHSVPNELIEIEVTENAYLTESAIQTLKKLSAAGFRIALDDFGKGYSSLSYIYDLPLDFLKLDRSFVDAIDKKENGKELVKDIINMAHNLNIKVVAEGVEDTSQLEYLQQCNCDIAQGYYFDRPLPSAKLEDKWFNIRGVEKNGSI